MRRATTLLAAAATVLLASTATAKDPGVHVGTLICDMTDSTNLLLYSNQTFDCTYDSVGGRSEQYSGRIDKVGADLSVKKGFRLIWIVKAPTLDDDAPGALRGHYVGVAADAAAGVGGGGKLMVGGSDNHFSLQPTSVSAVQGVGVAVGIHRFSLD
ncbi:MAG: DUF992 domain-containing protein [Pseudomonadota bacterium]